MTANIGINCFCPKCNKLERVIGINIFNDMFEILLECNLKLFIKHRSILSESHEIKPRGKEITKEIIMIVEVNQKVRRFLMENINHRIKHIFFKDGKFKFYLVAD